MNREDIIRMARDAGMEAVIDSPCVTFDFYDLKKFVILVAAAEREACAKVCDDLPVPPYVPDNNAHIWDVTCVDCAEAIRARGKR
jgi:hypothetical protein